MSSKRIHPTALVDLDAQIGSVGSARVSRAGERVLAVVNFSWRVSYRPDPAKGKIISARRRNQHARRMRYPDRERALEHAKRATIAIGTYSQQ